MTLIEAIRKSWGLTHLKSVRVVGIGQHGTYLVPDLLGGIGREVAARTAYQSHQLVALLVA